jgi:hypothetical protein
MLGAFLASLPIAVGMLLSTLPLVSVPLVLSTRRDRAAHLAFLGGWLAGILMLGGAAILLSDLSAAGGGAPARWVVWLRLALGVGLVALALRKWLRRTAPTGEVPAWMQVFETIRPQRSALLGSALIAANPKNIVLVATGALSIAAESPVPLEQATALLGFALVASLGLALPLALTLALGPRAQSPLDTVKRFMGRHSAMIVVVVLLGLGAVVIRNALADL